MTVHCNICFPKGKEIVKIGPSYSIVLDDDKCHLVHGEGHQSNILYTFESLPWSDPRSDNDLDMVWFNSAGEFTEKFRLRTDDAFNLVESCRKHIGYNNQCSFEFWFFDWVGQQIEIHQRKIDRVVPFDGFGRIEHGWNMRVMSHVEPSMARGGCGINRWFAIHEVYYNENGDPTSWTEEPAQFTAETLDGLIWYLERALEATKKEILEYPGFGTDNEDKTSNCGS